MKIIGAAVLAVSCLPYSSAFVGPLTKKPQMAAALNLMMPDAPVEVITGETPRSFLKQPLDNHGDTYHFFLRYRGCTNAASTVN